MPSLQVSVPHEHGKDVAKDKLCHFTEMIKSHYGDQVKDLEENWVEHCLQFGFSAKGFKVKGKVHVEEEAVTIDGSLPFAAAMFRGRIEKEIRTALTKALS